MSRKFYRKWQAINISMGGKYEVEQRIIIFLKESCKDKQRGVLKH